MALTKLQRETLKTSLAEEIANPKLDRFIMRAIEERGLTEEDVEWNRKLNRPLYWKETVHPEAEVARRTSFKG